MGLPKHSNQSKLWQKPKYQSTKKPIYNWVLKSSGQCFQSGFTDNISKSNTVLTDVKQSPCWDRNPLPPWTIWHLHWRCLWRNCRWNEMALCSGNIQAGRDGGEAKRAVCTLKCLDSFGTDGGNAELNLQTSHCLSPTYTNAFNVQRNLTVQKSVGKKRTDGLFQKWIQWRHLKQWF